ncbi:unnamed protein product [Arabidopsis thaliana]|uniref:Protein FANTASTIC FOUR 4 n=3 Tax=Arabidopsis TaxID=3701 RepID=FAF4_ARATH|nr:FANTASTIC four-like protein (DUF3049) [Arabidopsis thaliana]Q9SFG6.1 RecName: Full=Protein FANTASTIC FOUR 4 [Arabidopsis thaliana]KAG7630219.1 The fantastic four family [Arabidopsis suecica]AAF23215.1 hypothetical protein [Arabidopsis thaliana]AEE74331.1 FANTASTIC four-like protein (DUF3049) [Arabidopsis thaliana]CAA0381501.1 unnamed protein product [Arabidopsis thaliana]CAD5322223.1 unnamed protein product [Arabidopsis thaliana]|eukprot:NP_187253.1 FANTASTIC four-like protein (DUF3049) [Arabidopsis thaliana]
MATVVYQSYFESQHFEPRALRLRLSSHTNPQLSTPLKSHFQNSSIAPQDNPITINAASLPSSSPNPSSNSDTNSGSWSFLESLSNSSSNDKEKKTLPLFQSPSSRRTLSDESLALCTESLGSETGSDIIHEDMFSISSELQTMETRTTSTTSNPSRQDRKRNTMASLPPPLTSMIGFDCIEVKSHRENGRLVMMATRPPPRNRCLQDRSNGCVRLAILIDSDDHIETETKEEKEEEEEETIETVRDNEEEIPEYKEEEEEKEEEIKVKGVEKVQRSRRCIEGDRENRGFLNWESLCVATS